MQDKQMEVIIRNALKYILFPKKRYEIPSKERLRIHQELGKPMRSEERNRLARWWMNSSHEAVNEMVKELRVYMVFSEKMEREAARIELYRQLKAEYGNDPAPTPEQVEQCFSDVLRANEVKLLRLLNEK